MRFSKDTLPRQEARMRRTSGKWSTSIDAIGPTAAEVNRARLSQATVMGVLLMVLLVALGAEIRGRSSPLAGEASALANHGKPGAAWAERLGRLDEAIEMQSVSGAVYEWRSVYGE